MKDLIYSSFVFFLSLERSARERLPYLHLQPQAQLPRYRPPPDRARAAYIHAAPTKFAV